MINITTFVVWTCFLMVCLVFGRLYGHKCSWLRSKSSYSRPECSHWLIKTVLFEFGWRKIQIWIKTIKPQEWQRVQLNPNFELNPNFCLTSWNWRNSLVVFLLNKTSSTYGTSGSYYCPLSPLCKLLFRKTKRRNLLNVTSRAAVHKVRMHYLQKPT